MNTRANRQPSDARDAALKALSEAHRLMGGQNEEPKQLKEQEQTRLPHRLGKHPLVVGLIGVLSRRSISPSLVGLLAVGFIAVAFFAIKSTSGQVVPEPTSTSSVPPRKESAAQPAPRKADVEKQGPIPQPLRVQAQLERVAAEGAPVVPPMAPDLVQHIQAMPGEFANIEQAIDQLKTAQAQMVRENAELIEHLKAMEVIARRNAEIVQDLQDAQSQTARDNKSFAEQLKAGQEQMAAIAERLKESQEQLGRLVVAGQKPRPKPPPSSLPPTVPLAGRPAPASPLARVQTPNPRQQSAPKPQ